MKKFLIVFVFLFGFGVIITIVAFWGLFVAIFFILEFLVRKIKSIKKNTEDFFSILLEDENDSIFVAEAERPHIELKKE